MKIYMTHCVFPCPDFRKTAAFYEEKLGFRRVDYTDASEPHICLYRDGAEFILTDGKGIEAVPNRIRFGYGGDCYVITDDQRSLQEEFEKKGVKIAVRLHPTDYHNREFAIEDCDGRRIYFGIKEKEPEYVIETPRLRLRRYRREDFDALKEVISDPENMKYYERPYDDAGVSRWIEWNLDNYENLGFGLWAIERREDGRFLGDCGITIQNIRKKYVPEIGYHIHPAFHNLGYATEAARACKEWIFSNTVFKTVYSYQNAENAASRRVAEKNGMTLREIYTENGVRTTVYAVTEEEYRRSRGKGE